MLLKYQSYLKYNSYAEKIRIYKINYRLFPKSVEQNKGKKNARKDIF